MNFHIITAIVLNLVILAVNSGLAEDFRTDNGKLTTMFLFVALLILLCIVVLMGLMKGKQTRSKLLSGLIQMYEDENVSKYYDKTLLTNYNTRYNLFMMVVVLTGLISIVVPFVLR